MVKWSNSGKYFGEVARKYEEEKWFNKKFCFELVLHNNWHAIINSIEFVYHPLFCIQKLFRLFDCYLLWSLLLQIVSEPKLSKIHLTLLGKHSLFQYKLYVVVTIIESLRWNNFIFYAAFAFWIIWIRFTSKVKLLFSSLRWMIGIVMVAMILLENFSVLLLNLSSKQEKKWVCLNSLNALKHFRPGNVFF